MIAQFSVGNYLSFKNTQTVSFEATSLKDTNQTLYYNPTIPSIKLLKSISIQGSNSSGKSNFLKAFQFMKFWTVNSFNESNKSVFIPIQPYLLNINASEKKSFFEVQFYIEDIKYRYGFTINKDAIDEEWLYYSEPKKREQNYFFRKMNDVVFNNLWKRSTKAKVDPIVAYVKPSVLLISVLAQFNIDLGTLVIDWFNKNTVAFDLSEDYYINKTASLLEDEEYFIAIHHLIDKAKLGFSSLKHEIVGNEIPSHKFDKSFMDFAFYDVKNYKIQTQHDVFDDLNKKKGQILFDLRKQESAGTQKFFALAGFILATIKNKEILWVDELDSKFHSLLFETIIKFFNSHKFNHKGSQLIFTTHNTQLLKEKILRRDQIYTMNKTTQGESYISNAARSNIRMDISYEKQYFDGKFGGIQKINLEDSQLNLFGDI